MKRAHQKFFHILFNFLQNITLNLLKHNIISFSPYFSQNQIIRTDKIGQHTL